MDRAFEKSRVLQGSEAASGHKRENVNELPVDAQTAPSLPKQKRQRLCENLQNGGNASHMGGAENIAFHDATSQSDGSKAERPSDVPSHAHPTTENSDGSVAIPVRPYLGSYLTKRETRSQTKQQNSTIDKYVLSMSLPGNWNR